MKLNVAAHGWVKQTQWSRCFLLSFFGLWSVSVPTSLQELHHQMETFKRRKKKTECTILLLLLFFYATFSSVWLNAVKTCCVNFAGQTWKWKGYSASVGFAVDETLNRAKKMKWSWSCLVYTLIGHNTSCSAVSLIFVIAIGLLRCFITLFP